MDDWTGDTDTLVSTSYPEPLYSPNNILASCDFTSFLASDTGLGNIILSSPTEPKTALFYITNSQWKLGKPSVTISSRSKDGPILGVLNLGWGSENVFCLYDPATENIPWEGLTSASKLTHGTYEIEFRGRKFAWQRTRQSLSGDDPDLELRSSPGQDVVGGQGEVLAVYKAWTGLSWKKRGTIYMRQEAFSGLGGGGFKNAKEDKMKELGDWEIAALLTCLGIIEGARRRAGQGATSRGRG